jgi:type I restriction enzyme S subunit
MEMRWLKVALENLKVLGPQYGANARAVPWTGLRPRYVRITDIDANGQLRRDDVVEADLEDNSEFVLREGDLLFARSGNTVGKTYRYSTEDGNCIFAGYLIRFRLEPRIADSRFVFHFTQSAAYRDWVDRKKHVAGQPNINGTEYSSLTIPLPPLSEQSRIVDVLEHANKLRRDVSEARVRFSHILTGVFYKMFGDPASNPKGWPTERLDEVVEIGTQLVDPNQPEYLGLPHVGGEQIEKETGRILSPKLVRDSDLRSGKFLFRAHHVLYSKIRPYLNKVAYPRFDGLCSADIYPLSLKNNQLGPWYLVALLRSRAFQDYAQIHSSRLRMPKLNQDQLGAFRVPVPDPQAVGHFEAHAKELAHLEEARFSQDEKLDTLFQILQSKAFMGAITARWRGEHMTQLLQEIEEQSKLLNLPKETLPC